MAIARWDPFSELLSLQDEFNKVFEDKLSKRFGGEEISQNTISPAVDIYEDENKVTIEAELPGLTQKDIDVKVENNTLVIKGEKKFEKEDKKDNYHRIERYYGTFQRSFILPETVDSDKIKAEYKNGVLEINIPKKPEVKPKAVKVEVK